MSRRIVLNGGNVLGAILRGKHAEAGASQVAHEARVTEALDARRGKDGKLKVSVHQRGWNQARTQAIPFCGFPLPGPLVLDPLKVTCPDCLAALRQAGILAHD